MDIIKDLLAQYGIPQFYVKLGLGILCSFLLTFYTIPTVVKISRRKNLMDEPGSRSSHLRKIPNLGGISMFYSLAVCASIFAFELFDLYKFLFASLVILLYIGVMDDIVVMRAYKTFCTDYCYFADGYRFGCPHQKFFWTFWSL